MKTILTNARLFTSQSIEKNLHVIIDKGIICKVTHHTKDFKTTDNILDLENHLLAPGFIDTQVNGGAGILFNHQPTAQSIQKIAEAHRTYGTTGFLPTLVSDSPAVIDQAIQAANTAQRCKTPGFLGLHLEGPFLSKAKRGVHEFDKLSTPSTQTIKHLAKLGQIGSSMVTLAPEVVESGFIQALTQQGVIVSIGHSNASYEQINQAIKEGATGFTHLFNAMSPLNSREPGVVGAALADRNTWCGIIVDSHHVHPASLSIAIRAKEPGKMMLVTDAIHSVGAQGKDFEFCGQKVLRAEGKITTSDGTLAGSDLDMASAVRNTVNLLGLPLEEALRMASLYPASYLGIDHKYGRIAPGYQASLVLLDEKLKVLNTWIDGI